MHKNFSQLSFVVSITRIVSKAWLTAYGSRKLTSFCVLIKAPKLLQQRRKLACLIFTLVSGTSVQANPELSHTYTHLLRPSYAEDIILRLKVHRAMRIGNMNSISAIISDEVPLW